MLPAKFGSIWPSSFRGEDFLNIIQSETRIALGVIFVGEWDEMKKVYRGPYIDAFCQVWFHLVQLFQRSRLKYEKLTNGRWTDNGRQVMAIPHMTVWVRWAKKVVTTKYLAKFQSPRAITRPKMIGPERNVNLICNLSLYTHIPNIKSISQSIAKKSGDNCFISELRTWVTLYVPAT